MNSNMNIHANIFMNIPNIIMCLWMVNIYRCISMNILYVPS